MNEDEKTKLALIGLAGVTTLWLLERYKSRWNEAHYNRQLKLAKFKNDVLYRYISNEVKEPDAMSSLIMEAKYVEIIENNNLD